MAKGIGIAALVIVLISFVVPLVGNFVALAALVIAAVGALAGDRAFAIATAIVAGVKFFFLSPVWMGMLYGGDPDGGRSTLLITVIALALPIVGIVINAIARSPSSETEEVG